MPNQGTTLAGVEKIAVRLAEELGYEWIDLELVKEPAGRFLRFFIDKEGGITLDDVEAFHRKIQPYAENVDYDYMEVSSPGIDRPLKKQRDFERNLGNVVEVKLYAPRNKKKEFMGELVSFDEEGFLINTKDAQERFTYKETAQVRPHIEF